MQAGGGQQYAVVNLDLGLSSRGGAVNISRLEPRSHTPPGGSRIQPGSNATANGSIGTWGPYSPAGAMGYLWARVDYSSGSSSGGGSSDAAWYPVCFRTENEPALKAANLMYAVTACVDAGYSLGYSLPPSYTAAYGGSSTTGASTPPPHFPGGGGGNGTVGQGEQQQQQQQLFISNMGCILYSGPDGSSTECTGDLGPQCLGAPAVLSCIPNATGEYRARRQIDVKGEGGRRACKCVTAGRAWKCVTAAEGMPGMRSTPECSIGSRLARNETIALYIMSLTHARNTHALHDATCRSWIRAGSGCCCGLAGAASDCRNQRRRYGTDVRGRQRAVRQKLRALRVAGRQHAVRDGG